MKLPPSRKVAGVGGSFSPSIFGSEAAQHEAIAAHEDSTRVCAWGATWAMLRAAEPGEGRLLCYEQSKESNGSMVSVAALVWP